MTKNTKLLIVAVIGLTMCGCEAHKGNKCKVDTSIALIGIPILVTDTICVDILINTHQPIK